MIKKTPPIRPSADEWGVCRCNIISHKGSFEALGYQKTHLFRLQDATGSGNNLHSGFGYLVYEME